MDRIVTFFWQIIISYFLSNMLLKHCYLVNPGDTKVDLVKLGLSTADGVYMMGELQSKMCRWLRKRSLKMSLYIRPHPLSQLITYIRIYVYSTKLGINYDGS